MLQPLETQYLQHESHRIIRRCLISSKRPVSKTGNAFLRLDFKKLSHFRFEHKDNANGAGGSSRSLVLLLFTRFSRDCTEISLFGSSEVYRSWPDVLGRSARGPARTFSDIVPGKGLMGLHCSVMQHGNVTGSPSFKTILVSLIPKSKMLKCWILFHIQNMISGLELFTLATDKR